MRMTIPKNLAMIGTPQYTVDAYNEWVRPLRLDLYESGFAV